ncbi:glycogen synthase GlgA [Treponema phagedenis]|uniref:glycogen synthase GlgA n=1 Tax=Treponema phagedenis TaxID=162 RepID=UPI0001F63D05|nr:glycogen synthase GlgA [Treponema phagedenis]EFW37559.1 glycogen/starch synthase, ADP-glucose type [Treponema phagedenis F0421]TYT79250.1 glycogen synthase GlgA [Treponema phagedenis]
MKILMVTSEAVPFAKTGGLADAVSALALALRKKGHDVRIVMPRYYKIDRKKLNAIPGPLSIHIGHQEFWTAVFESVLPNSDVPVYFIDHEQSFGRDGIYGSSAEPDFSDNPMRFSILSHAAFQVCRKQHWYPDIIHAHDWAAALAPVLLKFKASHTAEFSKTGSVFTIHNIGYQGIYGKDKYPDTGLDWNYFYAAGFEDWDRINFLKAGIISADKLTTVSPTYAKEIQRSEYGFRMDGILRYRSEDLTGILNGVDTEIWNPQKDTYIPFQYSAKTLHKKEKNKAALQERMGLPVDPDQPLFGMITRLVDQKGISELFGPAYGSAYRICTDIKLQMVVLGSGDRWCENELSALASKLPNLKVYIGYDEALSHLIEAGSDFFLMPSRYEPCGLNQMYSLLYGTLPIVRNTGGLADTVENYNERTGEGTGFMFNYASPQSIYDTVGWAAYAWFNKKDHILAMRKRGMAKKFGWNISADKYIDVYKRTLKDRGF